MSIIHGTISVFNVCLEAKQYQYNYLANNL